MAPCRGRSSCDLLAEPKISQSSKAIVQSMLRASSSIAILLLTRLRLHKILPVEIHNGKRIGGSP
eukprot:235163-Hanusia_phi.AAC.1